MSDITVSIGANATQFNRVVKDVRGQAAGMAKGLASALGGGGLAGGLAGAGALTAMVSVLGAAAKKGDEIADGAKRMGVTTDEYQKMAFAAEQSGASIDTVSGAIKKMKVNIDAGSKATEYMTEENKGASQAFNALGISAKELVGMSASEQFSRISDALAGVSNETEKAALATKIFGKAGQDLLPMLSAGFSAAAKEAENIGLMSASAVDAADRLGDSVNALNTALLAMAANTGVINFLAAMADGLEKTATMSERAAKAKATGQGAQGGLMGFIDDMSQNGLGKISPVMMLWKILRGLKDEGAVHDTSATSKEEVTAANASKVKREQESKAAKEAREKNRQEKLDKADLQGRQEVWNETEKDNIATRGRNLDIQGEEIQKQLDYYAALEKTLSKSEMLTDEKKRQLAVDEEIDKAIQAGILDDAELAKIAERTGKAFDAEQAKKAPQQITPEVSDQLLRIGGRIGNEQPRETAAKKQVNLLEQTVKALTEQTQIYRAYTSSEGE